jgi:hypothetical protein
MKKIIQIFIRNTNGIKLLIPIFIAGLFSMSTLYVSASDKLVNYCLFGAVNIAKFEATPSFGGLVSVKLKGNLGVESGYKCDVFMESKTSELLDVSNTLLYHSIPVGLTYSLNNFNFVIGPSFQFIGYAEMTTERVYHNFKGYRRIKYLDSKEITESYRNMFCSLFCNVRYNFGDYYGVGATYGYGITDRFANSLFKSPFQYASLCFYLRLNDSLLK